MKNCLNVLLRLLVFGPLLTSRDSENNDFADRWLGGIFGFEQII